MYPNHFNLPEITALNNARSSVAETIYQSYRNLAPQSHELILGQEFFEAIEPQIPQTTRLFQAQTFFSQLIPAGDDSLLIINMIYSGLTLMFSRFEHCFMDNPEDTSVAELRQMLKRLQPAGAVFAELKGGYDATNLNLHPIFTSYELVCPGELSSRPLAEQIPLEDLSIQDDVQQGRLRLYSKREQHCLQRTILKRWRPWPHVS